MRRFVHTFLSVALNFVNCGLDVTRSAIENVSRVAGIWPTTAWGIATPLIVSAAPLHPDQTHLHRTERKNLATTRKKKGHRRHCVRVN
jgi:hypothetical protein